MSIRYTQVPSCGVNLKSSQKLFGYIHNIQVTIEFAKQVIIAASNIQQLYETDDCFSLLIKCGTAL